MENDCSSCSNDSYSCVDLIAGLQICYLLNDDYTIDFQVRFADTILANLQIMSDRPSSYYVNVGPYILDLDISIVPFLEKSCLHVKGDIKTIFGDLITNFEFDMVCF